MLPDLTVLVALIVGLIGLVEGQAADPLLALVGTGACVCVAVALTWMAGERGVQGVRDGQAAVVLSAVRWAGLWPLLGWLGAIRFFDWAALVGGTVPEAWWLGRYVILFLPAIPMFLAAWVQRARIEGEVATARGAVLPAGGSREAIRHGLRRNAIALFPLFVVLGVLDGIFVLGELGVPGMATTALWLEALPLLSVGAMLLVLGLLTMFLPAIFRRILPTETLPPGPVRTRLEQHAAALGLRFRDLLVWKTAGRTLNAMVIGFTPGTRLIFLTDALLDRLPESEVLAVFSHEAGHARRHHLPLFLLMFVTTAVLFSVTTDIFVEYGVDPLILTAIHLAFIWFVLFGVVSRIFEREADIFGAEHAADSSPDAPPTTSIRGLDAPLPSGAAWMITALDRIRTLSGRGASHRHGTIDERMENVARCALEPAARSAFAVTRRRLSVAIAASVALAVLAIGWRLPGDIELGRAYVAWSGANDAYAAGVEARADDREAEAKRHWERALDGFERAGLLVRDNTRTRARQLSLHSLFGAADSAFHGLDDEVRGRVGFERMLEYASSSDLPREETQVLRYQAHIDIGRILAHQNESAAFDVWSKARSTLPGGTSEDESWYRARLRLLRAVLLARVEMALEVARIVDPLGLLQEAATLGRQDLNGVPRDMLEGLAKRREKGDPWDEMRRDARRELERLPLVR